MARYCGSFKSLAGLGSITPHFSPLLTTQSPPFPIPLPSTKTVASFSCPMLANLHRKLVSTPKIVSFYSENPEFIPRKKGVYTPGSQSVKGMHGLPIIVLIHEASNCETSCFL